MEQVELLSEEHNPIQETGTLAIDLGNSTTVVAFQGELDKTIKLLNLPPITRVKGEIPSLVWSSKDLPNHYLVGNEVSMIENSNQKYSNLQADFKRWICSPQRFIRNNSLVSPEKAGEILIREIWNHLPKQLTIKRLVLTAPVDTYKEYRSWLVNVCSELKVDEIALVDEPTAAAMGAGLPAGSILLVVDMGGSTIDMSLVEIEGGEGKAEPVAQLLRFGGNDLEGKSNQILRCAKVLGKAGQRIGGRDIDKWIANRIYPNTSMNEILLNAAERLKCRLSKSNLKETQVLIEKIETESNEPSKELRLSKFELENLLKEKGLLKILDKLLKHTLSSGKLNNCQIEDISNVVLVGGGARIPIIQSWLKEQCAPIPLLTPPSIEAVAIGALNLTPGVTVRDVLRQGVSLRCWDQKNNSYIWHPLFLAGQPWPTSNPLEVILATSRENQTEIELTIGEPESEGAYAVFYIDGIPTINSDPVEPIIKAWDNSKISIPLTEPGQPGEDCLKLKFSVNNDCQLIMEGIDLRDDKKITQRILGSIR